MNIELDREGWLTECAGFLLDDIVMPAVRDDYDRPPVRLSVGFPSGRRGRAVAVCFRREASTDGHNEIFVSPTLDDSITILGALVHELIHAVDDCASGHRNFFARTARAVGLEGPLTATHAGDALSTELQGYVDLLGPIPHARLDLDARRKQGTRMIKVACRDCGFTFRTTRKWIDALAPSAPCPVCRHDGTLTVN